MRVCGECKSFGTEDWHLFTPKKHGGSRSQRLRARQCHDISANNYLLEPECSGCNRFEPKEAEDDRATR